MNAPKSAGKVVTQSPSRGDAPKGSTVIDLDRDLTLARWYHDHGRHDLPWRQTRDRWAVLVSEVMLHQTQVAAGRARCTTRSWRVSRPRRSWPTRDRAQSSPRGATSAIRGGLAASSTRPRSYATTAGPTTSPSFPGSAATPRRRSPRRSTTSTFPRSRSTCGASSSASSACASPSATPSARWCASVGHCTDATVCSRSWTSAPSSADRGRRAAASVRCGDAARRGARSPTRRVTPRRRSRAASANGGDR